MTSLRTRAAALAAVAAIGFATLATGAAHATPAPTAPAVAEAPALTAAALSTPTRIPGNSSIGRNQAWYSPDGRTMLAMQGDGNVVLYRDSKVMWVAQGAMPRGEVLTMQGDGNLVVYAADSTPLWNSQTGGKWGATLLIYNEGAIAVELNGKILWTSAPATTPLPPCPPWGPPIPGQIVWPWCPTWPFPS
ncbi:hypothetical protein [Kitasatospora sp. MBT66]|uniref:hypothetical protein n=1 Tax=Kitasatospora sp. MBT66 TaxID=1444769 RepID=UPI00068F764F|nr:hypothetical protein [Kitasatospora sp. MBT66]